MINLQKLTVDDLIVEYMTHKVQNGYEPSFLTSEFLSFLSYFINKIEVNYNVIEDKTLLLKFFERKLKTDWSVARGFNIGERDFKPHMDLEFSANDQDYLIKANYMLSASDRNSSNADFIDIGEIIKEFLSKQPKREIDELSLIDEQDLSIGKQLAARIIESVWLSHISKQISQNMWPRQCRDINKYLFQTDLARIIGLKSIKKDLTKLYKALSQRIAVLYHNDRTLKISSYDDDYLARANYDLLIQGFESIMSIAFGPKKKYLEIDLSILPLKNNHKIDDSGDWTGDPIIKISYATVKEEQITKLVDYLEDDKKHI